MRAVVQRVAEAWVRIGEREAGRIGPGLLVLLGVARDDAEADAALLAQKIVHLRIFPDESGALNRSVLETTGELLVVSQFTLYGDCRKGRRPSFLEAAPAESAQALYASFVSKARTSGLHVEEGVFRAMMEVGLVNQGPVTLLLDSRRTF